MLTPQKRSLGTKRLPPPMGGMNTADPLLTLSDSDCPRLLNMTPAEMGLRVRLGTSEWVTGLTGAGTNEVRTVLNFKGATTSKRWACTNTGIWDITSSTAAPTQVVAFPTVSAFSGWGSGVTFVSAASGGHFFVYADEENGLYFYNETLVGAVLAGTWTKATIGAGAFQFTVASGLDPATVAHVTVWKARVWMTQKNTSYGWFTDILTLFGNATRQNFAGRFKAGGYLLGLWNWSLDAGSGMDTSLVGVSSGGDVVIYQGTDPTSAAAFSIKGTWFIGGVVAGRRIVTDFGGDLLILAQGGVVPLSKLVQGNPVFDRSLYSTYKVNNLYQAQAIATGSAYGWSMAQSPQDGTIMLLMPSGAGQGGGFIATSMLNKAWSPYSFPLLSPYSMETVDGVLWIGTTDGRIVRHAGYMDEVTTLGTPRAGSAIPFGLVTSFSNLGSPNFKSVPMVRPTILAQGPTSLSTFLRFQFDASEVTLDSGVLQGLNSKLWATAGSPLATDALWDIATWAGGYTSSQTVQGAVGMGVDVAVGLTGYATTRTVLLAVDVFFQEGGPL